MDILFIVPNMNSGGAQKVILNLVKNLPRKNNTIYLIVINLIGSFKDDLPDDIKIINLNIKKVRYSFAKILFYIWTLKPDIVFSTLGHLNKMLCFLKFLFPSKTKLIVRETTIVSHSKQNKKKNIFDDLFTHNIYNKADKIVCQSNYMKFDLLENFNIDSKKINVIYNPVDVNYIEKKGKEFNPFGSKKITNIIAIGRLNKVKRFDKIIKKITLFEERDKIKLWILGEGNEKEKLNKIINDLNLNNKVNLVGFKSNPYAWLYHADLFVLASEFEGLPNVLLEAIASNCSVVSLKHPGGTSEIMELTDLSHRFVNDLNWKEEWFEKPSEKHKNYLKKYFGIDKIIVDYENLFKSLK